MTTQDILNVALIVGGFSAAGIGAGSVMAIVPNASRDNVAGRFVSAAGLALLLLSLVGAAASAGVVLEIYKTGAMQ